MTGTRSRPLALTLALVAATVVLLGASGDGDAASRPRAQWPVPVPAFFWDWAAWYLHRGDYATEAPRAAEARPASAPARIPAWAWRRLRALRGERLPAPPSGTLRPGSSGRDVRVLQRTLGSIGLPSGPVDGLYGERTRDAVVAFEKLHGLELDGRVDPGEYLDVLQARRPPPPRGGARGSYVYVDLPRQLLFDVEDDRVAAVIAISTGGGYSYTGLDGRRHLARTPRGRFVVFRKVAGWDESYLGRLYYPVYFEGGYAIHGSADVPLRPVSHGCVRIPLWLAKRFFARHAIGTPVLVVG